MHPPKRKMKKLITQTIPKFAKYKPMEELSPVMVLMSLRWDLKRIIRGRRISLLKLT
jgi:hypothetical protein